MEDIKNAVRLASIPAESYSKYRYQAICSAYKWDPQVGDHNTVSRHVALLSGTMAKQLSIWAERLARETVAMEDALARDMPLAKELGLPRETYGALKRLSNYDANRHVRLMRFDFHPTMEGWSVSEVNSDVPGGFAEASALPALAAEYCKGYTPGRNAARCLVEACKGKIPPEGTVAFIHCTSYADDRQVMQCLSDAFALEGYKTIFAAPDHIRWVEQKAVCVLEGAQGPVDGIIRFFPLEWLANLPRETHWQGFFSGVTAACNHPIAMFTQSKRLPLVWSRLGVDNQTWKMLLPETKDPKKQPPMDGWIYKPALGRVGEGISVKGVLPQKELRRIEKAVRRHPMGWVAQRMFKSRPLITEKGGSYHLCIGVFTIEGRQAGFYGRISPYPRIDANAEDIPVLVEMEGKEFEG